MQVVSTSTEEQEQETKKENKKKQKQKQKKKNKKKLLPKRRVVNPPIQDGVVSIHRTVKRFGKRGGWCYVPRKWLGRKVQIELLD